MEVIYGLIPSMIIIGLILIVILFWAIKSGQFDDFEGEGHRILMDEDLSPENVISEKESHLEEKKTENVPEKEDKTKNND